MCSTPRQRSAASTRQAILAAARTHFLNESYETVGLRDIARDAGVDATLVNRYFGSKEELFKEVLTAGPAKDFGQSAQDVPAVMAGMVTDHCRVADPDGLERLLIILRSASSPSAATIVARSVEEELLEPLSQLIGGDAARLRATLALSVMIGSTVLRSILGVTTDSECRPELMHDRLVEMFRAAVAEALPAAAEPA